MSSRWSTTIDAWQAVCIHHGRIEAPPEGKEDYRHKDTRLSGWRTAKSNLVHAQYIVCEGDIVTDTRATFTCRSCGNETVWGKPTTAVLRAGCEQQLAAEGEPDPDPIQPIERLLHWWAKVPMEQRVQFIASALDCTPEELDEALELAFGTADDGSDDTLAEHAPAL